MAIYRIVEDKVENPEDCLRSALRLSLPRATELDLRCTAVSGHDAAALLHAAKQRGLRLRVHLTLAQLEQVHRTVAEAAQPQPVQIECHVEATQLPADWSAIPASLRTRLTIRLAPGTSPPQLPSTCRSVRFELSPSHRAGDALALDGYRQLATALTEHIQHLSRAGCEVGFRGALPFCAFSDAEQGVLARECLAVEDYRRPELLLAYRSDGDVAPWRGPLQNLLMAPADERSLRSFFRARQLAGVGGPAFSSCGDCALRRSGVCSAWQDLAPPTPSVPTRAIVPQATLLAPDADVWLAQSPAAAVSTDDSGHRLQIAADRTLPAMLLNPAALKVWQTIGSGIPVTSLQAQVAKTSTALVAPVMTLVEQLQQLGFVLAQHGDGERP